MARQKFNVLQPPTSADIEARALAALGENALVNLVLLATEQDIPKATPQEISFRIRQTGHPDAGGMIITGFTEPGEKHIIIETLPEATEMATATIVSV